MSLVTKVQQWRRRGSDGATGGPRMSESSGERSRGAEQEKSCGSGTLGVWDGMGGGRALCLAPRHRVGPVPAVFWRAGPSLPTGAAGSLGTSWFIGLGRPGHEPSRAVSCLGRASGCLLMYNYKY
jgi:hypothetical protein